METPTRRMAAVLALILASCLAASVAWAAPANDNIADAIELIGDTGSLTGTNIDATGETGEPDHWYSEPFRSVWYYWTAQTNEMMEFNTFGSNFDTTLAVYTGSAIDQLNLIAANDDNYGRQSQVIFSATAGQTYYIAVDGYGGSDGDIVLNWQQYDGIAITGTITLPSTETYADDIFINVNFYSDDSFVAHSYVYIPAYTTTSEQFFVTLPKNIANLTCMFYVDTYNLGPEFLSEFYYGNKGPVGVRDNASIIDTSTSRDLGTIPLLAGNIVSGTIGLQGEDTFSTYADISVYALWGSEWWEQTNTYIYAESGDSTLNYALAVPKDAPDYVLQYYIWNGPPTYTQTGYYATINDPYCTGDTFINNQDYENIEINMLKGHTLKGNVILPGPTKSEPFAVTIGSFEDPQGIYGTTLYGHKRTSVTVPADAGSVAYEMGLPHSCDPGLPGRLVYYAQTGNSDYVPVGYYADPGNPSYPGMTGTIRDAGQLAANTSYDPVNLTLIQGNSFSGEVSLPTGDTAGPDGLDVTLGTFNDIEGIYHTTVTIVPNENSAPFALQVSPDMGDITIRFLQRETTQYAKSGYYATTDTANPYNVTGALAYADNLDASVPVSGANFVLPPAATVSGTFINSIPSNEDDPIEVTLTADPADPDAVYWHTVLYVPPGATQLPYTSPNLVLDKAVIAGFSNSDNPEWAAAGYYAGPTATVVSAAAATWLSAWTDHYEINLYLSDTSAGDINADGQVDLIDSILGLQIVTGGPVSQPITIRADVDGDGLLGLIETLEALRTTAEQP